MFFNVIYGQRQKQQGTPSGVIYLRKHEKSNAGYHLVKPRKNYKKFNRATAPGNKIIKTRQALIAILKKYADTKGSAKE